MLVGLSTCGCGVTYQLIVTYPLVVVWNIFLLSILPTWGNDPIFYFRLFSRILFGVLLVYFFECKPHRSTALPQPSRSAETAGASCFGELPVVESEPIASGLLRESTRKLSKFAKCQGKRGWSLNQPMIHACFFFVGFLFVSTQKNGHFPRNIAAVAGYYGQEKTSLKPIFWCLKVR